MKILKKLFSINKLNEDQKKALEVLNGSGNVFLTGPAGVGKSYVIKTYLNQKSKIPPVLASTGAAAVQINGRTFHSFFGLGIMEGGISKTVKRATDSDRIWRRIAQTKEIIIDEISMIHPLAFEAADQISKAIKENTSPFGGIRLILTGDFLQLPPVDRFEKKIPWLFQHQLWAQINPKKVELLKSMRTESQEFVNILNKIRLGNCDSQVESFLNSRVTPLKEDFDGTVLFGRKAEAESYNQDQLDKLKTHLKEFHTQVSVVSGIQTPKETLISYSPLPEVLFLKEGALVMIRKNDPDGEYVNGTLAHIKTVNTETITLKLRNEKQVSIPKEDFHVLDGDGKIMATIRNFPLTLGWATTIHKSQGASIDCLHVNLRALWECGQAYVALSRAKDPNALFIEEWTPGSIKADGSVISFYGS